MNHSCLWGKKKLTGEERTPEEKIKDEEKLEGLTNLPIQGEQELIDTGRSVQLYMPAGLQYRDTVNYENMDLGGMRKDALLVVVF